MNKKMNLINILFFIATVIGGILYITIHTIPIKAVASFCFFLMSFFNLIYSKKKGGTNISFGIIMTLGLFVAMIADIFLEIEFIIGAALFALGHIFYFVSYCKLLKFKINDLVYAVFIFIVTGSLILFLPIFDFGDAVMQIVCVVYALIISLMVSKAISNYKRDKNRLSLVLAIGSVLFCFSDTMLLFNYFADTPRIINILCVTSYYIAQPVLAYGVCVSADINMNMRTDN